MSTNLERVGSLAVRLGLSWNMKIQNCKYFWNTRHCLLFTSGGTPSLTKETVSSMKEVSNSFWMTNPYFVQLLIQETLSRCLGWRMMINRGKRKLGETKNFRYLLKYIPPKSGKYHEYVFCYWCSKKDTHMVISKWPCPVEGRNVDILGEMTCRSYLRTQKNPKWNYSKMRLTMSYFFKAMTLVSAADH